MKSFATVSRIQSFSANPKQLGRVLLSCNSTTSHRSTLQFGVSVCKLFKGSPSERKTTALASTSRQVDQNQENLFEILAKEAKLKKELQNIEEETKQTAIKLQEQKRELETLRHEVVELSKYEVKKKKIEAEIEYTQKAFEKALADEEEIPLPNPIDGIRQNPVRDATDRLIDLRAEKLNTEKKLELFQVEKLRVSWKENLIALLEKQLKERDEKRQKTKQAYEEIKKKETKTPATISSNTQICSQYSTKILSWTTISIQMYLSSMKQ